MSSEIIIKNFLSNIRSRDQVLNCEQIVQQINNELNSNNCFHNNFDQNIGIFCLKFIFLKLFFEIIFNYKLS
jgi:hypothetical protein